MQDDKGNVTIQFPKREEGQSSRISVQGSRTSSPPRQSFEINSRKSSVKLDSVDFTPNIPHLRCVTQESPLTSPTPSQMLSDEPNQLMVIDSTEPFQIDKEYLSKEFHLPKHNKKRVVFLHQTYHSNKT